MQSKEDVKCEDVTLLRFEDVTLLRF